MAADKARISYFAGRKYREVVTQQGRVMLDADANEAQRIVTEERRLEAIDYVGPAGTPDDGYKVTPAEEGSFTVGVGTMYVGGNRVTLEGSVDYRKQPEWLDSGATGTWTDGLWLDPKEVLKGVAATLVLREQEITAVEDAALRDIALGGPDTSARSRLVQRIVAVPTKATTCPAAAVDITGFFDGRGLIYSPTTGDLRSRARLQVTLVTGPPPISPCDPPAAAGYLGADNQLIRIQVADLDAAGTAGTLLWGYSNASTLYAATVLTATTVQLATRPIALEFEPRTGQAVQILQRAADLGEGATAAALTGPYAKLTAYARDTRTITLPSALPGSLVGQTVFVRLWEDATAFAGGTAVELKNTGFKVTITQAVAGRLHVGDYWSIAARPGDPTKIYPERILSTPQPPDGPRMWACCLAVLQPAASVVPALAVADDCRLPFDNLVELTARKAESCACTICVSPADHKSGKLTIQKAIDTVIASGGGTVCLEPGNYNQSDNLKIQGSKVGLRIVGHGAATSISFVAGPLLVIDESRNTVLDSFALRFRDLDKTPGIGVSTSTGVSIRRLDLSADGGSFPLIGLTASLGTLEVLNCSLTGPVGISTLGSTTLDRLTVKDNSFLARDMGLRVQLTASIGTIQVRGNDFAKCGEGGMHFSAAVTKNGWFHVSDNTLNVTGFGASVSADNVTLAENEFFVPNNSAVVIEATAAKQVDNISISANRIFHGEAPAILVSKVSMSSVTVHNNQAQGDGPGLEARGIRLINGLDLTSNQWQTIQPAVAIEADDARLGLRGNSFDVKRAPVGIDVFARKELECHYCENRSSHSIKNQTGVRIRSSAGLVIFSSNRVANAGVTLPAEGCTVLGNITAKAINLGSSALGAPWLPLNIYV